MLKRIIKSIALRIYRIGYFEHLRREAIGKQEELNKKALVGKNVWIAEEASIINKAHPNTRMKIGDNSRIMGGLLLFDFDGEIEIGSDCFVGPDTRIWSAKKIKIGNRVLIAHNVNIHDNISHPLDAKERYEEFKTFVSTGLHERTELKGEPIIIEDDVWIGFNCTILRGVKIGRGAIIGAGTLVTKNVEPWTVNIGVPSQCVKTLTPPESF